MGTSSPEGLRGFSYPTHFPERISALYGVLAAPCVEVPMNSKLQACFSFVNKQITAVSRLHDQDALSKMTEVVIVCLHTKVTNVSVLCMFILFSLINKIFSAFLSTLSGVGLTTCP